MLVFEGAAVGKPTLPEKLGEFYDLRHKAEADHTEYLDGNLTEDSLSETQVEELIKKSRDEAALEEYLTAYHSVIPSTKPMRCEFDYFSSAEACDEMGFEMFTTLSLNRVACALGMGFFSLGSAATLPWGHIFFHRFSWTQEEREQYRSMSRAEHENLAKNWAADQTIAAGIPTIGLTLLYRYIDPLNRPNPLGVEGPAVHVLPRARAILYLQSDKSDRTVMRPNLLLRWALEHFSGLTEDSTPADNSGSVISSDNVRYKRFSPRRR